MHCRKETKENALDLFTRPKKRHGLMGRGNSYGNSGYTFRKKIPHIPLMRSEFLIRRSSQLQCCLDCVHSTTDLAALRLTAFHEIHVLHVL